MIRRFWFTAVPLTLVPMLAVLSTAGCSDSPKAITPPTPSSASSTPPSASTSNVAAPATASIATPQTEKALPKSEPPQSYTATNDATKNGTPKVDTAAGAKKEPPAAAASHPKPTQAQIDSWKLPDFEPFRLLACYDGFGDGFLQSMSVSLDGSRILVGGARLTLWSPTKDKPLVDLLEGIPESKFERPIRCVGISPDGNWLAAGDQKGTLRVWKMSDQSEMYSIRAHDGYLSRLAISPDSQSIATTSYGGEVRLWNATTGKKIKSIKVGTQEVEGMCFVGNDRLATVTNEVSLWNIESGSQESVLSTGRVINPALGISYDRRTLLFGDGDGTLKLWDVGTPNGENGLTLKGSSTPAIAFSKDGKWIATYSQDQTVRIWDAMTRQPLQVIDADGSRTVEVAWLPESNLLVIASERGRIRLWGTASAAQSIGLQPIELPIIPPLADNEHRPLGSSQWQSIIDVRSFPQLPGAQPQWGQSGTASYVVTAKQSDAELFYRYVLGKAGWRETTTGAPSQPGLSFDKQGCVLNVTFYAASPPSGKPGDLNVSLHFSGNYDARWLPKVSPIATNRDFHAFSSDSFSTKASLTEVEIGLLKGYHQAGWTPYSRLNASSAEDPTSRMFSFVQGGSELSVFVRPPFDAPDELVVQTSISVTQKSIPIPRDSGWIEYDASSDIQLVANTDMNMEETVAYYDLAMRLDGWMAREAGRQLLDEEKTSDKVKRAFLPYIRGEQDMVVRLVGLPNNRTRILVGEPENSSWQLKPEPKVDEEKASKGIEAAEFALPSGATQIKYDVDDKKIEFALNDMTPPIVAEQIAKQMVALEWKQEDRGVKSDDYTFLTFTKGKAELQLRARLVDGKNSAVMIGGDGLLWNKPLPTPPERISYSTWLRRDKRSASLEWLDQFAEEMRAIPPK